MHPDPGPLKPEMAVDKEPRAGALGVAPVRHGVLHVRHAGAELWVLQLGTVNLRMMEFRITKTI